MLQKRSIVQKPLHPVLFSLTGLLCLLVFAGSRCEASKPVAHSGTSLLSSDSLPYDLSSPAKKYVFEDPALIEISGIGFTSTPGILVSIADEKGEVLMIDLNQEGTVIQRIPFKEKGDFEGIEMVGDTIYAIQSNAKLFEIINWKNNNTPPTVNIYTSKLNEENDIEGLGYDPVSRQLLIACKENPELKTKRDIWGFDLRTKQLSEKPKYSIDPDVIDKLVEPQEDDKERYFSSSGIAVQPGTGDLYVTSSALKRLAVIDGRSGELKYAIRIDRQLLAQPEGIAFDKDGNMYISSEGKKQQGYILKYEKRKLR